MTLLSNSAGNAGFGGGDRFESILFRMNSKAGVGLVAALISLLYRGKLNVSRMLLDRLLRRLLDHIYSSEEKEDVKEQSWSWISFHSVPHSQRKVWAKFAIRILVRIHILKSCCLDGTP